METWEWIDYKEAESTNDIAKEKSGKACGKKFVITAEKQTKGRGRLGRKWKSYKGNLFASLGIEIEISQLGELIFVVGLSLLEAIRHLSPKADIKLKWPNDVLLKGKKISGILLEKGEGDYIIIGIGVNISKSPQDKDVIYPATNLKDEGIKTTRIDFLKVYLDAFDKNLFIWHQDSFEEIKKSWLKNVKGLGKEIIISMDNDTKEGIFEGVDDNGLLLLRGSDGVKKIYAGDVFYKE